MSHKSTIILNGNDEKDLVSASIFLKKGGLVALPTETVYGLASNGLLESAVANIFKTKGRPHNNPLILHVKNLNAALELFAIPNQRMLRRINILAKTFWPGPLTVVAKKSSHVPSYVTAKKDTVAVRIPCAKPTLNILEKLDFPLAMPSANISTRPSPTSAEHVLLTLAGLIDAVVDFGPCPLGIESTVIDIDNTQPRILRPGSITKSELEYVLEEEVLLWSSTNSTGPECPGQHYLHYSPKVSSVLLCQSSEMTKHWPSNCSVLIQQSDHLELSNKLGPRPASAMTIILSNDNHGFASALYDAFYKFEKQPYEKLVIVMPKNETEEWQGVRDRIRRSAKS